ncbi:CatB-related O-acetyltransferase [Massilimicrobiota sp. An134]|uniref:CatB-related O-acetyltransferase n=1 Tax=Massilimicrobiota sp. An134 TaxID=1965557 RepID=UPI0013024DAD|nr:CatB-related O-acetyltransferase [Massilimicrobiota sp. An134]
MNKNILLEKAISIFYKRKIFWKIVLRFDNDESFLLREYYKKCFNIEIGKYTYGFDSKNTLIQSGTKIGKFCSIAPGVKIGLMNHPLNYLSTHPFLYYKNRGFINKNIDEFVNIPKVIIQDDVWIGSNAIILPGITVGKGSVIAAGAVVTKNVPPYTVWGGIPAKQIKKRFDNDTIDFLLSIDWCSWDKEKIKMQLCHMYDEKNFYKLGEQFR